MRPTDTERGTGAMSIAIWMFSAGVRVRLHRLKNGAQHWVSRNDCLILGLPEQPPDPNDPTDSSRTGYRADWLVARMSASQRLTLSGYIHP